MSWQRSAIIEEYDWALSDESVMQNLGLWFWKCVAKIEMGIYYLEIPTCFRRIIWRIRPDGFQNNNWIPTATSVSPSCLVFQSCSTRISFIRTSRQPATRNNFITNIAVDHFDIWRHVVDGIFGSSIATICVIKSCSTIPIVSMMSPTMDWRIPTTLPNYSLNFGSNKIITV